MKSVILFFFLITPFFLSAQIPLAELSKMEKGGDVSKYVEIHISFYGIAKYRLSYCGTKTRLKKHVKGKNGKEFKFENYVDIWAYMKSQNYEFVKEFSDGFEGERIIARQIWEKRK